MRLNFTANSFVFGRINRENAPRTFYIPRKAKTSKMRLNFTTKSFIFGPKNCEYAPRALSEKLAGNELPKCVSTPRQTASFLDANAVIMCPELFYKPRKVKTSEMCLNFAGNNFIFGHINRENAPRNLFV